MVNQKKEMKKWNKKVPNRSEVSEEQKKNKNKILKFIKNE